MRKLLIAVAVGGMVSIGHLMANTIVTTTTGFNGGMTGGEFLTSLDGGPAFSTFCIELGETFSPGTQYLYSFNDRALLGGGNHDVSQVGYDKLSAGSAWLYSQFRSGALNAGYYANHWANGGAMQNAFWALEDEKTLAAAGGTANQYIAMVLSQYGWDGVSDHMTAWASAQADYTGSGICVINVFDAQGNRHQDLIGCVPDGGMTLVLLGMGLSSLSLVARRLRG